MASAKQRARVLAAYGGRCDWCGQTKALELDHIHNDGAAHRAAIGMALEAWLITEHQRTGVWPPLVHLLCRACHNRKSGRIPRMAPSSQKVQCNVTIPEDLSRALAALAATPDYGSKGAVVEAALRQLLEGQLGAAALDSVQQRFDTLRLEVVTAIQALAEQIRHAPPPARVALPDVERHLADLFIGFDRLKEEVARLGRGRPTGWRGLLHRLID